MLEKLVLDQDKEQEIQKSKTKEINYKILEKVQNFKKRLEDQNMLNIKLYKINLDLRDEIQMIEEENEDQMK